MSTKDPVQFGKAVLDRREALGLSQLQVWDRGGPSNTTLTAIENGRSVDLSPSTAKKLDRGLGWIEGSALSLWREGKAPVEKRVWAAPDYSGPTWAADSDDPWVPAQVALKNYVDTLLNELEEEMAALTERVIDLEHQVEELRPDEVVSEGADTFPAAADESGLEDPGEFNT